MIVKNLRWYIVLLLLASTTISYLDRQTLTVAAPVIRERFKMSNEDFGKIVRAFLFTYAIMQPFTGRIIDLVRTRLGFTLAVIWWSIANMATVFAGGVFSFGLFRAMSGIGEAGNFPAAIRTISEWFPVKERTVATGIFNTGAGLGAIIAPLLLVPIVIHYGWRAPFIVTGVVGFFWVIVWLWFYREPERHPYLSAEELAHIQSDREPLAPGAPATQGGGSWGEIIKRREFWGLALAQFLAGPVWWFLIFWMIPYLKDGRHFTLKEIGMLAWIPYLTADIGSIVGGLIPAWLIRRGVSVLWARKLSMCLCAAIAPFAIYNVPASGSVMAICLLCVATAAMQGWSASVLTLPADLFPKRLVATAFGMMAFFTSMGGVLIQAKIGRMVDTVGYARVFTMIAVLPPLAAAIMLALLRPSRQDS